MGAWPEVRLDECCTIVSGATPSTSVPDYWDGDIPWATPKDLSELASAVIADTPRKITAAGLASCAATVLPTGSVLFSSRAPIGHVAINAVPMATNQGFKSFVPKKGIIEARFLYWWLKANRRYLESLGNGATFKEVSKAVVSRVRIPLPPLDEQQRIAEVLDKVEVLRGLRLDSLSRCSALASAAFEQMFGSGECAPGMARSTTLGAVTEVITKGTTPTSLGLEMAVAGVPFVRVQNLRNGTVDLTVDPQFIPMETHRALARSIIRSGDVLVSIAGTIGRAALVQNHDPEMNCNQAVAIIRPKNELLGSFLLYWLESDVARRQIRGGEVTGTITNLSLTQLRTLQIDVPPLELQREFQSRLAGVEHTRSMCSRSLFLSCELMDSVTASALPVWPQLNRSSDGGNF